jgi:hypothetical protein
VPEASYFLPTNIIANLQHHVIFSNTKGQFFKMIIFYFFNENYEVGLSLNENRPFPSREFFFIVDKIIIKLKKS